MTAPTLLAARRAQALAAGATPTAAFLHGYTAGLVAAALLVAIGGAVSLATLDRSTTRQPQPRCRGSALPRQYHPRGTDPATGVNGRNVTLRGRTRGAAVDHGVVAADQWQPGIAGGSC